MRAQSSGNCLALPAGRNNLPHIVRFAEADSLTADGRDTSAETVEDQSGIAIRCQNRVQASNFDELSSLRPIASPNTKNHSWPALISSLPPLQGQCHRFIKRQTSQQLGLANEYSVAREAGEGELLISHDSQRAQKRSVIFCSHPQKTTELNLAYCVLDCSSRRYVKDAPLDLQMRCTRPS